MEIPGFRSNICFLYKSLILFPLLFSTPSCITHTQSQESGVRIIEPLSTTHEITDLTSFIEKIELVPVSVDPLPFSSVVKMLPAKVFFILSGGVVYSVSRDGREVKKIGNVGRGPGEYIMLKDIALNMTESELWCLDTFNDILKYDVETGSFIEKVDIGQEIGAARAIVPMIDDNFAMYVPNPPEVGKDSWCLRFYDKNGRERGKGLKSDCFNIDMGFSVPVSRSDGGVYVLSPESSCPSMVFGKGEHVDRFFFDFGKKNVPEDFFEGCVSPWEKVGEVFERDFFKIVSAVYFLKDGIYFRAFGKESSSWNFILDKEGNKGIRWQSVGIMTPPVFAVSSEDGWLYFPYEDYGSIPIEEEKDPLKKFVINKFGMPESGFFCFLKIKIRV